MATRISIKLRVDSNVVTVTTEVGRILGGIIIFHPGNDIQGLSQIARIYREGEHGSVDPGHEVDASDSGKTFVVVRSPLPLLCAPEESYSTAEACIPQEFTISTKKALGGGWPTSVTATDPNGKEVDVQFSEDHDTYKVAYTPTEAGEYTITSTITVVSTVKVFVGAMEPDAPQCIAYGPGLERAEQFLPAVFTIESRNKLGKKLPTGGHPFNVAVKGPFGEDVPATVEDNGDGTYTATYHPVVPGEHVVDIKLDKDHIKDSPVTVGCESSTETANAAQSWAEGPGLENDVCSNRMPKGPATFTIHAVHADGTPKTSGGDLFSVMIEDPLFNIIPATVEDNGDGTYAVSYVPVEPGVHLVDVVLRNKVKPVLYEHIKDSTFKVSIKSGADPSKCTAEGPGLKDGILDTFPATFTITARDRDGKPIPEGGDDFQVTVEDPNGDLCPVSVVDNGDGTYGVTYEPTVPGPHVVKTTLDDTNIKDSPKTVVVKPGAYYATSYVEQFSYVIRTCDKRGNPLTTGGQDVKSFLSDATGGALDVDVKDNGNGTYTVTYKLPRLEALFNLSAQVDNKNIIGSPWTQSVGPVNPQ